MSGTRFTPYRGVMYDINEDWSVDAGYTGIFKPQDAVTADGKALEPIEGAISR